MSSSGVWTPEWRHSCAVALRLSMSLYRRLLLSSSSLSHLLLRRSLSCFFSFSSAEEAAAERRRRKRRLRIEPPLPPRAPSPFPRPPRDPREPDSTSSLVGPRLSLHNRVQSLIRSRDLDSAFSVARAAVFSRTRPSVFTCNSLISATHRSGRHADALSLFRFFFEQSRIAPNVVSHNILILALCDAGRVDDALAAYSRLLGSAPFPPSAVTFRHLTRGLVDAGRLPDALLLLREMMFTRNLAADSLVYNNVISGFLRRDDLPEALELFDELQERCAVYDGAVVATFMDWYFRKGRAKDAMETYWSLLDKRFEMSPSTSNALLEVLLRHGKEREANWLFDGMLSRHAPPKLRALNADTYNIMVNHCFRKGDFDGAVEAFCRTGTKPCSMDVACFNNIIGKLLENGLPDRAVQLFHEMSGKLVSPDEETYGLFVEFCFKERKVEDALRWFGDMVSQEGEKAPRVGIGSYNRMYDRLAKAGWVGEAMEMFRKMRERGVRPDSMSYKVLVTALCGEGLLDQVKSLVEEMVRIHVAYSPELQELVSEAFETEGRGREVEKMFGVPQSVVPPPHLQRPRQPLAYHQNPNVGAYRPPYDAGNRPSPAAGPPPNHPPGPEAVSATSPADFPAPQGTSHFASSPHHEHVAGHSQFPSPYQNLNNGRANAAHFVAQLAQPPPSIGPQTGDAMPPTTSAFSESQFPREASRNVQANNAWLPYMGHSRASQGEASQANNFQNSTAHPWPPREAAQHGALSASYQAQSSGDPQCSNSATTPQASCLTGNNVPHSAPSQCWNYGDTQRVHFTASWSANAAAPESSPPAFSFSPQNGMASQVPLSADPLPSTFTGQQAPQGMNLATCSSSVSESQQTGSSQDTWADHRRASAVPSGTYGQ